MADEVEPMTGEIAVTATGGEHLRASFARLEQAVALIGDRLNAIAATFEARRRA